MLVTYKKCRGEASFLSFHIAYHSYLIHLPHEAKHRKTERQNSTCSYGFGGDNVLWWDKQIKLEMPTGLEILFDFQAAAS